MNQINSKIYEMLYLTSLYLVNDHQCRQAIFLVHSSFSAAQLPAALGVEGILMTLLFSRVPLPTKEKYTFR